MPHRPDNAVARDSGGGFDSHPEGQFAMLCVDVVNMGTKMEQFAGHPPKEVEKVCLVFASGERQQPDKGGELIIVTVEMTLSMYELANLRKFLESWRGKSYSQEQVEAGVPLHKLHGQPALISIEHVTTRRGRKFAKVRSVSPLPKKMEAPPSDIVDEYKRPPFLEDKKGEYAEAVGKHRATLDDETPLPDEPPDDYDDGDGLPF